MFSTAVFKHYRDEFKKHNRDENVYLKFKKFVNSLKAQVIKTNRAHTANIFNRSTEYQQKYKPDSLHVYIVNHVFTVNYVNIVNMNYHGGNFCVTPL